MGLVHLHRHSEFSRLDGVGTAQQYAERAAEMGQAGLGLTDHATLSGLLHHIKACSGKGGVTFDPASRHASRLRKQGTWERNFKWESS